MKTVNSRKISSSENNNRSARKSIDENTDFTKISRRSSTRRGSTNPANIIAEELAQSRRQSAHRKSRSRNSQTANPLLGDIEKILNSTYQKQMKPPGRSSGTHSLFYSLRCHDSKNER